MKKLIFTCLCCFSLLCAASELRNGKILRVEHGPVYGNLVYVSVQGTFEQSSPGCATNPVYQYVFDTSTTAGMLLYSSVMSAQQRALNIGISGTTLCLPGTDSESMRWIRVEPAPAL